MQTTNHPGVWIISGPSGVGKGTVCARLVEAHPNIRVPVSMTTRAPRVGEIDGVSYRFVSEAEFLAAEARGELLESAVVHGRHRYGTPKDGVVEALAAGQHVVLEIDIQGARQVKANHPQAQLVFLAPPSWDELRRRLIGRGTEDAEAVTRRLASAEWELAAQAEADVVIVNDEIDSTVAALVDLLGL